MILATVTLEDLSYLNLPHSSHLYIEGKCMDMDWMAPVILVHDLQVDKSQGIVVYSTIVCVVVASFASI